MSARRILGLEMCIRDRLNTCKSNGKYFIETSVDLIYF